MSTITILHMSDIHFKRREYESRKAYRDQVKTKMIEKIKEHLDYNTVELDFAVITGDIAFSGKEYVEAKSFFNDFKKELPKTQFLAVPGNHDVDRSQVDKCFPIYENIIDKEKIEDFLGNEKHVREKINVKFKYFREFVKELNPALYRSEEDYFWVKDFDDKEVTFLGLNSCWASEGDNENFKIALGFPQLIEALRQSQQKYKILLLHHPLFDWFNKMDFQNIVAFC